MNRRPVSNNNYQNFNSIVTGAIECATEKQPSSIMYNNSVTMSCRDRTNEFHSTIRSFQSRMSNNPTAANMTGTVSPKGKNSTALQQRSQFMIYAKKIGRDLTNTCIKLEKLTDLAKKRTLFDDKPKEIQELTYLIKQDINNLHGEITRLQSFVKTQQENDSKNMQKHSSNVVYTLQSKLANVSKDFKQVLEVRNENMKQQTERGEQYFSKSTLNPSNAASILQPPKMPGSNMGKSVLLYDEANQSNDSNTVLNMDLMQKQQVQKRLILSEDVNFIQDRANAMQTVEQTIVELGTMFNQLATMIKEQEEQITRIDSNVDDIDMNVSEAHNELLKYFQSVTSNRWFMVKVFSVLIIFFVIFIVVMT